MILEAQPDIEVVAEAADGEAAVRLARRHRPDVVLMDVRMPGLDGLEATRRLVGAPVRRTSRLAPRIVILTTFDLDEYVYAALQAGRRAGSCSRTCHPSISSVRCGRSRSATRSSRHRSRAASSSDSRGRPPTPAVAPDALGRLTARETEVLGLLARGMSNAEIAEQLVVSEATVKTHVAGILAKLDLRNRAQAVVIAYESGLVRAGAEARTSD